jgi:hypothetical protein
MTVTRSATVEMTPMTVAQSLRRPTILFAAGSGGSLPLGTSGGGPGGYDVYAGGASSGDTSSCPVPGLTVRIGIWTGVVLQAQWEAES